MTTVPPSPAQGEPAGGPCEVPLVEQLRGIPIDARLIWTEPDGLQATHFVPVGILAHKAADEMDVARRQLAELQRQRDNAIASADDGSLRAQRLYEEKTALEHQLADSAHEVERLNAANAAMRGQYEGLQARWESAERWQLRMTGLQVRGVFDFIDGDDETEVLVQYAEERKDAEDGEMLPAGLYVSLVDYPDEGCVYLPQYPDAALAPTSHDPVRSAGETRPVPERGKCELPTSHEIGVAARAGSDAESDPYSYRIGFRAGANWLYDRVSPDCAQGGSPADPERQRMSYGSVNLDNPALTEAYRVACLIEECGASDALTRASSAAFDLIKLIDKALRDEGMRVGVGVLKERQRLDELADEPSVQLPQGVRRIDDQRLCEILSGYEDFPAPDFFETSSLAYEVRNWRMKPSPPPTAGPDGPSDIVAGLREILAGKNIAINPSIIERAIAALGEKGEK